MVPPKIKEKNAKTRIDPQILRSENEAIITLGFTLPLSLFFMSVSV